MIHPLLAALSAGPILLSDRRPDNVAHLAHLPAGGPPDRAILIDPTEGGGTQGPALYDVVEGVALIPVTGILVDRLGWIDPLGWVTGYDVLHRQIDAALADDAVRAVALIVDSPGGLLTGCEALADWLYGQRGGKPVAAIVTGMACSAAYWLASAAEAIALPRTGEVGSIGVYQLHIDMSGAFEAAGFRVTLVHAGARKIDGHAFGPLPDPVRDRFQMRLERVRRLFASQVACNRGLDVQSVMATEADVFDGIGDQDSEAVALGLVDRVLAPEAALEALIAQASSPTGSSPAT